MEKSTIGLLIVAAVAAGLVGTFGPQLAQTAFAQGSSSSSAAVGSGGASTAATGSAATGGSTSGGGGGSFAGSCTAFDVIGQSLGLPAISCNGF
jgi:hypothetical protein